jgi:hypothetical protein
MVTLLTGDAVIAALIADRVAWQELASLHNPIYPLVTINTRRGHQEAFVHQQFPLIIGAHSERTQEEALTIAEAVATRLRNLTPGLPFVVFPDGTPTMTYVAVARIHNIFIRYQCHRLGV